MAVILGAVVPSSAVLVPEVGRGRERPAVRTIGAARRIGRMLQELRTDRLVLLLPPTEIEGGRVITARGGTLRRAFDRLDAPELVRHDVLDLPLAGSLLEAAPSGELEALERADAPEAALAALAFLSPSASLPLTLVTVPAVALERAARLGAALAEAAIWSGGHVAVCAIGELSSRLFRGAPGGYRESAAEFDRRAVERLQARGPGAVAELPADGRADAGESVIPQLIALGEVLPASHELLLSYEGPFGVGFLVAAWATKAASHPR